MRILVTGTGGFVGVHFVDALRDVYGKHVELALTALNTQMHPTLGTLTALDVTDGSAVDQAIEEFAPTHVVHLAGIAAAAEAAVSPDNAWAVHLHGALNLSRAILRHAPKARLLHIGTGMAYGSSALSNKPLDENAALAPFDEYSASKAAADLALGALANKGLNCIRVRPFNHTGPGQTGDFAAPAFALQIARIEAGLEPPVVRVGNLDAQRDFLDVRDVVRGYVLMLEGRKDSPAGEVYNVASGVPRRVREVFDYFVAQCRVDVTVETDAARMRPSDLPYLVGDATKLRTDLGWEEKIDFETMLNGVLEDCRKRVVRT